MINFFTVVISFFTEIIHYFRENHDPVSFQVQRGNLINSKLKILMEKFEFDRVSIFKFHNGGHFYTGEPMQKVSCAYEVSESGIKNCYLDRQRIPIVAYQDFFYDLLDKNALFVPVLEERGCSLSKKLKEEGVESFYAFSLQHPNKKYIIGYLTLESIKNKKEIIDKNGIREIQSLCLQLSENLCLFSSQEKKLKFKFSLLYAIIFLQFCYILHLLKLLDFILSLLT